VVGVEPGRFSGTERIDPAELETGMRPYLGGRGPQWSPHNVLIQGKLVILILVEPPRWGDPIYCLHRDTPRQKAGAVLVRRHGATHPASPEEMQELQVRLLRRADLVQVHVTWASDASRVTPIDIGPKTIEAWVGAEGTELLAFLENHSDATALKESRGPVSLDSLRKQAGSLSMRDLKELEERQATGEKLTPEESAQLQSARELLARTMKPLVRGFIASEDRSPETYRKEVEEYLQGLREVALVAGIRAAMKNSLGELRLAVANETDRNFPKVEIELHASGPVLAFEEEPDGDNFPARPRGYGTPRPSPLGSSLLSSISPGVIPRFRGPTVRLPTMTIDNSASARITFSPIDLRPRRQELLPPFHLLVPAGLAGKSVPANWTATSTGADGMASGSLSIEVSPVAVTIGDLLRAAHPEGSG
jgi:hypothetical protein